MRYKITSLKHFSKYQIETTKKNYIIIIRDKLNEKLLTCLCSYYFRWVNRPFWRLDWGPHYPWMASWWIPFNLQDSGAGLKAGQSTTDRQQWLHIQYQVPRGERCLLAMFGEAQRKPLQGVGDGTQWWFPIQQHLSQPSASCQGSHCCRDHGGSKSRGNKRFVQTCTSYC